MRRADIPQKLRDKFEQFGEDVLAQALASGRHSAAYAELEFLQNEEDARRHALSWLSEKHNRARRKVWFGWGLSLIIIGIAVYNLWLAQQANRPNLVITDARLYINHLGNPPPELVQINWRNVGQRAALRGTATVFTVSEDGKRHENFGFREIITDAQTRSTTLGQIIGGGYVERPVDMETFLGLFLVCVKYHDENNHSYNRLLFFAWAHHFPITFLPDSMNLHHRRTGCVTS